MDKTILVDRDIEEGRRLIEAIIRDGFPLEAAIWFFDSEAGEWRLMLASSLVEEKGPRIAYAWIQPILAGLSLTITLPDIWLTNSKRDVVRLLSTASPVDPSLPGIRISRSAIGGVYIDDAYVYRLPTAETTPAPSPV
jgi:hypothetical protein